MKYLVALYLMSYAPQYCSIRKIVSFAAIALLFAPQASTHCTAPPRLICAEYSQSTLVVEATLIQTRHVVPEHKDDFFIYTLQTIRTLRGTEVPSLQITEFNGTGRASFVWKRGRSYLLFLKPVGDGTWWLEGCGYSGPLNEAASTLMVIATLKTRTGGLINGTVISAHDWISNAGITIQIHGDSRDYTTTTDRDGNFSIHVTPGHYQVHAIEPGSTFQTDSYSNEDPNNITIELGGCAQITFERGEEKYRND
jgi:hypothetical protein